MATTFEVRLLRLEQLVGFAELDVLLLYEGLLRDYVVVDVGEVGNGADPFAHRFAGDAHFFHD